MSLVLLVVFTLGLGVTAYISWSLLQKNAREEVLMGSLTVVFALVFVVLNVMLSRMIVRPISLMSRAADHVSTGDFDGAELSEQRKDGIAVLGRAFNRMRRSLQDEVAMSQMGRVRATLPLFHGRS